MSVTSPGLTNQTYIITQAQKTYTHPNFVSDPAYCELEYTYSMTRFTDDSSQPASAISPLTATTSSPQQFAIQYSADLSPVKPIAQKQVVTVSARSYSKYNNANS